MILENIQMKNGLKYEFKSHIHPHTPSIGVRVSLASPHSTYWGSRAKQVGLLVKCADLAKLIDPQSMKENELITTKSGIRVDDW